MSKRTLVGLTFVEKIFGVIIAILGLILIHYTYTNLDVAGTATKFFLPAGFLLIILGFVLLLARAE